MCRLYGGAKVSQSELVRLTIVAPHRMPPSAQAADSSDDGALSREGDEVRGRL
jgi:hypothetical protein